MKQSVRQTFVSKINDILAMRITMLVGSIWAFYAFVIFGLTPMLWPNYETEILYWSNFLQLVFLPVITADTAIMNRDSERRAKEDHHTIRKEFELLQEAHGMLDKWLKEIAFGVRELLVRVHHQDTATLKSLVEEAGAPSKKVSQG
jgi:hypothetical protein